MTAKSHPHNRRFFRTQFEQIPTFEPGNSGFEGGDNSFIRRQHAR